MLVERDEEKKNEKKKKMNKFTIKNGNLDRQMHKKIYSLIKCFIYSQLIWIFEIKFK